MIVRCWDSSESIALFESLKYLLQEESFGFQNKISPVLESTTALGFIPVHILNSASYVESATETAVGPHLVLA